MSFYEKLTTIAEKQSDLKDAGKKTERFEFWDKYQQNGNRSNYNYAFYGWSNDLYTPQYDIVMTSGAGLYQSSLIKDTLVNVDASKTSGTLSVFNGASKLETIRKLIVSENTTYSQWFTTASKLKNLIIEGIIGNTINLSASPLTVDSAKSVINALKNYSGTDKEFTYTVTFSSTTKALLETEGATAPDGMTWLEYAEYVKGWNT